MTLQKKCGKMYAKSKVRMNENEMETEFPKEFSRNSSAPATEENRRFFEVLL